MRLVRAPKATGAEQAEANVGDLEESKVVGGARGKPALDVETGTIVFASRNLG